MEVEIEEQSPDKVEESKIIDTSEHLVFSNDKPNESLSIALWYNRERP